MILQKVRSGVLCVNVCVGSNQYLIGKRQQYQRGRINYATVAEFGRRDRTFNADAKAHHRFESCRLYLGALPHLSKECRRGQKEEKETT
jgi:hypothetical protein